MADLVGSFVTAWFKIREIDRVTDSELSRYTTLSVSLAASWLGISWGLFVAYTVGRESIEDWLLVTLFALIVASNISLLYVVPKSIDSLSRKLRAMNDAAIVHVIREEFPIKDASSEVARAENAESKAQVDFSEKVSSMSEMKPREDEGTEKPSGKAVEISMDAMRTTIWQILVGTFVASYVTLYVALVFSESHPISGWFASPIAAGVGAILAFGFLMLFLSIMRMSPRMILAWTDRLANWALRKNRNH